MPTIAVSGTWTFSEGIDVADLDAALALRHRAFLSGPLRGFYETVSGVAPHGRDTAPHDLMARHYVVRDADGAVIATGRAIVGAPTAATAAIAELVRRFPPARGLAMTTRLPTASIYAGHLPDQVRAWCEDPRVVELSRVCTDPSLGAASPRAYRFLVEAGLATEFLVHGVERAVANCPTYLVPAYAQLGFRACGTAEVPLVDGRREAIALLLLDREGLFRSLGERHLGQIADEVRASGEVCVLDGPPRVRAGL